VAVHVTDLVPGELVTSAPQLCDAMPERVSAAPALAVAAVFTRTGLGLTEGFRVGRVLSTFFGPKLTLALLPALSLAETLTSRVTPSALKTWLAGQDVARPEPESLQAK
jgi:hypothetical protein